MSTEHDASNIRSTYTNSATAIRLVMEGIAQAEALAVAALDPAEPS